MITSSSSEQQQAAKMFPHHPANGDSSWDGRSAGGGVLVELVSGDKVNGQRDLDVVFLSFSHQVLDDASALLIEQGRTDLMAKG